MNITIFNDTLSASINTKGAELFSLKDNSGKEYMWDGNPEFWGKHSPVLFPIVGTLTNNTYTYNEKSYTLSRHGFARDNEFSVKSQDKHSVVFALKANEQTLKVYPFNFELEIHYSFHKNVFTVSYVVMNNGNNSMPFSIGAHPAFALHGNFEEYSLKFEIDEKPVYTRLDNDLLSGINVVLPLQKGILPLSHDLFKDDALVFKTIHSKSIEIQKNGNSFLRISYKDFPHLGIWTKPGAPFICIEPWQGYADAITSTGDIHNKEGILSLKAGESVKLEFEIQILA